MTEASAFVKKLPRESSPASCDLPGSGDGEDGRQRLRQEAQARPRLVAWRQAAQVSCQGLAGYVPAGADPCSLHHPLRCSPQLAVLE
jgi:hypothetical protein